jgi:hypothetical protein
VEIPEIKFQISDKIGLFALVEIFVIPVTEFPAAVAFAEIVNPRADGAEDQQPAEEADGGLPGVLAEVAELCRSELAPGVEPFAGLLAEFPRAVRQRVASGVGKQGADVAFELGYVFANAADEIFHFTVF